MKKLLIIIAALLLAGLTWLFVTRPEPPFGAGPTKTPGPTYFAEIDSNGIVLRVIVISQENIDTGKWGDPKNWIETTRDGSKRKNYAGVGYKYDKALDAFIGPRPRPDAVLDINGKWHMPEISKIASQ